MLPKKTVLACLLLPVLAGCVPGLTWLPDSSGFIYTTGKDYRTLMFFDAAAGKVRMLAKDTKVPTLWPAVSPDGKTIALAFEEVKPAKKNVPPKPGTLQVVFFNRDGHEVKSSQIFEWITQKAGAFRYPPPQLFWSPDGSQILVFASMATGVYGVQRDSFQAHPKTSLMVFGHAPFAPGGRGFLALQEKMGQNQIVFVDSTGRESEISASPDLFPEGQKKNDRTSMLVVPYLAASAWDGATAQVRWRNELIDIDIKNKKASLKLVDPPRTADKKVIHQEFRFPKTGVQVQLIDVNHQPSDKLRLRLEIVRSRAAPQVVLQSLNSCLLVPSPDSRHVALRCFLGDNGTAADQRIVVVNGEGRVVAAEPAGE